MDQSKHRREQNLGLGDECEQEGNVGIDLTQNFEQPTVDGKIKEEDSAPEQDNAEEDEWLDILGSGQLKKKVLKKGNSQRPERSFVCIVSYEGSLPDGTLVEKEIRASIQIGDGEVVQGLDLALPLMDIEEVALVEVGPRFAYGSLGRQPNIYPDMTLLYKVELHSAGPEPEVDTFSVSERKRIGNRKRERGNWWYTRHQPNLAIQCYRRALDYLDDVEGGIQIKADHEDDDTPISQELRDLFEDRLKVYNNLAAAQMQIKAYDTALQSVEYVLRCQPKNVKALFRKGKIFAAKGDFAKSLEMLRLASKLEPEDRGIRQELIKVQNLKKDNSTIEKKLYRKMFGHDKKSEAEGDDDENKKKPFPWFTLFASTTAVVIGALVYRYKF